MAVSPPPANAKSTKVEPTSPGSPSASNSVRTTVLWVVLACLMLGASAAVRAMQDRRYLEESNFSQDCPFPLEEIPRNLGRWKSIDDDQKLDSKTLLITGGKEYTIRIYTDDLTGVKLVVLLLFGPVEPVIPHIPPVCYPANGFKKVDEPLNRKVKFSYLDANGKKIEKSAEKSTEKETEKKYDGPLAAFRSAVYQKSRLLEGVYYSFRYDGQWTPDVALGKGLGRKNLGVFKVQIQRLVAEGESRDGDKYPEPIEDFLGELIPVIEYKVAQAEAKAKSPSNSVAAATPSK